MGAPYAEAPGWSTVDLRRQGGRGEGGVEDVVVVVNVEKHGGTPSGIVSARTEATYQRLAAAITPKTLPKQPTTRTIIVRAFPSSVVPRFHFRQL